MRSKMHSGFTLVELAIVIVIIGLLVGGVLQGQELIKQAKLNNLIKDMQSYKTSYEVFRSKYNAIPGDMRNATQFWGTASGGCPYGVRSGTQTCNGNGDLQVVSGTAELYLVWQHLANANLIKGSYTGIPGDTSNVDGSHLPGINSPDTSYSNNSGMGMRFLNLSNSTTGHWKVNFGNYLSIGKTNTTALYENNLFSLEDTRAIDIKMDDGKPGNGKILAAWYSTCSDATAIDDFDADYRTSTSSAPACHLQYRIEQ